MYTYAPIAATTINKRLKKIYFFPSVFLILSSTFFFSFWIAFLVVYASLIIFSRLENFFSWSSLPRIKAIEMPDMNKT
jgi:hypothetical protein